MKARDVMAFPVITIRPNAWIEEVAKHLCSGELAARLL